MKWISVKERLPKPYRTVLVFSYSTSIGYYTPGDGWYEGVFLGREIKNVKHWMPLPENPKESDSNDFSRKKS